MDEVVELVAPVRGGGQAEPAADRDLLDGLLEGCCRNVVALVGDGQPVGGGEVGDVVPPRERLQGQDVDRPAELRPAAAELPGLDAEELGDPCPPLVGERFAVD